MLLVFLLRVAGFVGVIECFLGSDNGYHLETSENSEVVEEPTLFNPKIWAQNSKLLAIQDRDTFCKSNTDAIFPDTYDGSLYYRCRSGKKESYQCIEGFQFDSNKLHCIPQNYSHNQVFSNECFHQMNGFYPDHTSNCQNYFECKDGFKTKQASCPPRQAFSFHLQSCQLKKLVTCVKVNCHVSNDGFYIYPGSKCQAYYYCGQSIRSDFLCPKGSIFNKQSKFCVESGICYEPVCTGRVDGNYADTTQDCARSFECKGGVLTKVDSCPSGRKFDGYSCSSISRPGNCEKPEKTAAAFYFRANDDCKSLHDGSHIIPGTDCRNVRICLRGKTTAAFECLKDQRFNGQQCFPKNIVPCEDVCSMKADGYYPDKFTNCQGYYSCLNGKVIRRIQCPNNTAFNGHMCVPDYLVSCPKKSHSLMGKCLGLRDGFHPDYFSSCKNYFYCYNYEMVLKGSCSKGIWEERQCVEKQDSICEGPKELKECKGLSPGLYQNKSSGCTKYFYCNSGTGTILSCPPRRVFNGVKCVNSDIYTCTSSSDCVNEPDGYRQDKSTSCRSYYYCSNGNKITYICPVGFLFNGSHCESSTSYKCPFIPSKDCIGKLDGYHPDISSNCKKYYYCYKEEKLNVLICGGKKIFDGKGCVLVENPILLCPKQENTLCLEKKNGIYGDPETDCRRYFSCNNKTTRYENWCPEGYGFDGRTCVRSFSCSSEIGRPIYHESYLGFFQDLASNCRNYIVCIGRIKITATCPTGTIFNGQLCIDSNYYKCPNEKT